MEPKVLTAGGASLAILKAADDSDSPDSAAGSLPASSSFEAENRKVRDNAIKITYKDDSAAKDVEADYDQYGDEEEDIDDPEKEPFTRNTDDLYKESSTSPSSPQPSSTTASQIIWLVICFFGIMFSFVAYGLLLEYATSGGRKLHELSFLFVTSVLYTITGAAGRYVRNETPTTIPPARFAVLGMTSMGSTFCSVRSLRYVIYPIQVLAKSCKPVPVMLMGALMGKKYPLKKYINVILIVAGVGLFMGGGDKSKKHSGSEEELSSSSQLMGIILLFISLCFDGGTGAYEDKLMAVHSVGAFDLMYNIQLGKTIIAGVSLLVLNQIHVFMQMCQEMGFVLVALGLTGAMGQAFIFITISKFGALTCSIIGLARKVTTLVFSIYFYGHVLNSVQGAGLFICIGAMVMNFWGKKGKNKGGHGHGGGDHAPAPTKEFDQKNNDQDKLTPYKDSYAEENMGDMELLPVGGVKIIKAGNV